MKLQALWQAFSTVPRRHLLLPAVGAAAGFAIAGLALLNRLAPPVEGVPAGYVALVNGKGILQSDFMSQTADTTGGTFDEATPAQRSKVLHDMIDEELLIQRGVVLDLPETTVEVRSVMAAAVDAQVAQPTLAVPVTDEDLKAYYAAHRSAFSTEGSMQLTELVLHVGGYENVDQSTAQAETDAAEAVYQLRSGAERRHVMDHFGLVESGRTDNFEQLDPIVKMRLGEHLFAVAQSLDEGQVSEPQVEPDGVHVLIMDKRTPERIADFDTVRAKVYTEFRDAQRRRAAAENLQVLRSEARIVLAPGQQE